MTRAVLDHLVVAAATLEQGADFVERALGARPGPGGRHLAMGTHNLLLGLGPDAYLEVIAIDPDGAAPDRPRWFGLDDPALQAALRDSPRLVTWVARTGDIAAASAACPIPLGPVTPMSRGELTWRITIPADGHPPGGGLIPALIQWNVPDPPSRRLPDQGCRLAGLEGTHPDPASITAPLRALGLGAALSVRSGPRPELAARFTTPEGERRIGS